MADNKNSIKTFWKRTKPGILPFYLRLRQTTLDEFMEMSGIKITKVTECKMCGSQLKEAPNWREDYGRTGILLICPKCGWSWG